MLTLYSGVNNSVSDINGDSNSAAANGADANDDDGGLMNPTALGFWILLGVILFVIVIALSVCYLCPRACKRESQRDAHRDAELSAQLQLARAREIERVRAERAQDSEPLFV